MMFHIKILLTEEEFLYFGNIVQFTSYLPIYINQVLKEKQSSDFIISH